MRLVSIAKMRDIEGAAISAGVSTSVMMEAAGNGVARVVLEYGIPKGVLGLIGRGNNGSDTLVALSVLAAGGVRAVALLVDRKPDDLSRRLEQNGGRIISFSAGMEKAGMASLMATCNVILDGILGIGAKLPLRGQVAAVLGEVKAALAEVGDSFTVIAIDSPSGVDCDAGAVDAATIPADLTLVMGACKQGLLRLPAHDFVGEIREVPLGFELPAGPDEIEVADRTMVSAVLPQRPSDSHKGMFGTALIVAGSSNYTGAPVLAAMGAYRCGTGIVTLAVPSSVHSALAAEMREPTWILLPAELGAISEAAAGVLGEAVDKASALLIGPGLGTAEVTRRFLEHFLLSHKSGASLAPRIGFVQQEAAKGQGDAAALPSMVVDADGLRLLAKIPGWSKLLPAETVLTPHPGEMTALTGMTREQVQADRVAVARRYAMEWGHVVVLKGAFTVVASPDSRTVLLPFATAALAKAGTGDVLAGLIVGLRAQGLSALDAAISGCWVHGQAGLLAADRCGSTAAVLASDVALAIGIVLGDLGLH